MFGHHSRESEAIEEAIVAELKNPQKRNKVCVNVKHKEGKFNDEVGRQILKKTAEEVMDNEEALAEGEFSTSNVLVVNVPQYDVEVEAILDTGCSKSVASEEWTKSDISSLSLEDRKTVVNKVSQNSFRCGEEVCGDDEDDEDDEDDQVIARIK